AGCRGAVAFFCAGGPGADPGRCAEARTAWSHTRARGRLLTRLAARLERLYAAAPPPRVRERRRAGLVAAAATSLERRRLGASSLGRGRPGAGGELVPPNTARLLGDLLYARRLDRFEALAPPAADGADTGADLGAALRALVAAVRGSRDPFAALETLASRHEG